MREIKFRGKRVDNGEWVYGSLYKEGSQVFILVGGRFYPEPSNGQSALGIMDWYEVFPDSIGQFTGLHDKNGVEIYEGDIVILGDDCIRHGYLYVISFRNGAFCVGLNNGETFGDFCSIRDGISQARNNDKVFTICVVGNIHEGEQPCTSAIVE